MKCWINKGKGVTRMINLYKYKKYLIVLCSLIFLLCGCDTKKKEDLSEYTVDLLQSVTTEFVKYQGMKAEKRLVSIDISAFQGIETEKFEEWIQETYADDNTVIVVFTDKSELFESRNEAEDYLRQSGYDNFDESDYDWTSITISRKSEKEPISKSEVLKIDISYPMIMAVEGFEVELEFDQEIWKIIEINPTYRS